jgi:hypothetical protein
MRTLLVMAFCLAPAIAIAETPPTPVSGSARTRSDPNERVCQSIHVIGSRLNIQRLCQTRAEWAAMERSNREGTQLQQTRQCPMARCE